MDLGLTRYLLYLIRVGMRPCYSDNTGCGRILFTIDVSVGKMSFVESNCNNIV